MIRLSRAKRLTILGFAMNFTGQNLSVDPLTGAAGTAAITDTAEPASAPLSDDKSLKNKGFSDYMQGGEESDQAAASDAIEASVEELTADEAVNTGTVIPSANQAPKTLFAAASGSSLPVAGSKLPTARVGVDPATASMMAATANVTSSSLQQGLDIKAQIANNPLVIAATEHAFVELKEIASTTVGNSPLTAEAAQAYRSTNGAVLQTAVALAVGKPGWSEAVIQRVMWMSSQNISRAEIALNPPELGPMHVKISSTGDQASVVFSSNHGSVRDALDQSLSRLREMMEHQGINLSDVNVSDQSVFQQSQQAETEEARAAAGDRPVDESLQQSADEPVAVAQSLALVDQYV